VVDASPRPFAQFPLQDGPDIELGEPLGLHVAVAVGSE
jgi:hypothetical protein